MNKGFFIFAFIILNLQLGAQTGNLSGTITDASTKEPVSFAHITIQSSGKTILTTVCDLEGKYLIKDLSAGTYSVSFEYIRYDETQRQVQVFSDSTTTLNIDLKEMDCHQHYAIPPVCPKGTHTSKILPIVYGKPDAVTKSSKVYYGGEKVKCEEYYCKKHKKAF